MTTQDPQTTPNPTDTNPAAPAANVQPEKKFTQEDFDFHLGKRSGEAKRQRDTELLKELGFEKWDDVKALIKSKKEADDAQKSELQKAQEKIAAAEQKAAAAEAARVTLEQERRVDKINSRIEALAIGSKAQVPADVVDYLHKHHADAIKALLGKDGKFNDTEAAKLIEAVKKARSHWFSMTGMGTISLREGRNADAQQDNLQRGQLATRRAIKRGEL